MRCSAHHARHLDCAASRESVAGSRACRWKPFADWLRYRDQRAAETRRRSRAGSPRDRWRVARIGLLPEAVSPDDASRRIVVSSFFSISYVTRANPRSSRAAARLRDLCRRIPAPSRHRRRAIRNVAARGRADGCRRLAVDVFARSRSLSEPRLPDGTRDANLPDLGASHRSMEKGRHVSMKTDRLQGRKRVCPAPKNFFRNSAQLAKKLRETLRKVRSCFKTCLPAARTRPGSGQPCG